MKEVVGDLWVYADIAIICIPTNSVIKANGRATMGKGVAKQATRRDPELSTLVGDLLCEKGSHVNRIGLKRMMIFPTKIEWKDPADLELIKRSAQELRWFALLRPNLIFILPRPGCGYGQRDWETEVKPLIESVLPDNVHVITN